MWVHDLLKYESELDKLGGFRGVVTFTPLYLFLLYPIFDLTFIIFAAKMTNILVAEKKTLITQAKALRGETHHVHQSDQRGFKLEFLKREKNSRRTP